MAGECTWEDVLVATREYAALVERTDERLHDLLDNQHVVPLEVSERELRRCLDLARQVIDAAHVHRERLEAFIGQRYDGTRDEHSRRGAAAKRRS